MSESLAAKATRRQGLRAIGAALPQVTKGALARRGFAAARLIADWEAIVGPVLASASIPERLLREKPGAEPTLLIKVAPGAALELQHLEPLVVERINSHFGFRAVARLKLKQAPVARQIVPQRRPAPLDPAVEETLAERVTEIADPGLQQALLALGRAVARRAPLKILVLAALCLSMAACSGAPAPPIAAAAGAQMLRWKAVLIAGDNQEPAFDNAVDAMQEKLAGWAVPQSSLTILKASAAGREAATLANIRRAFAAIDAASTDACFAFITSHGAPQRGLFLKLNGGFLSPDELARLLAGACKDKPTVVIASGCYSGSFAEGQSMPAANRVILTAARDDRPSFGCNANLRYTVFDRCILESLDGGLGWRSVMERARGCVAQNERALGITASSAPQLSVGRAVADLRVFPPRVANARE